MSECADEDARAGSMPATCAEYEITCYGCLLVYAQIYFDIKL